MRKLLPAKHDERRAAAFAVEKGVVCVLHYQRTTFAPQRRKDKPPLWLVLAAICALPLLIALALGLLVIRVLVLLFLLYMLGQVYGFLLELIGQAPDQLLSLLVFLTLAVCAALYWLLRQPRNPPGQPKG